MDNNVSPKYQRYADGYTKWLRHKNVEKRRKAARMVGELGVESAIPELIERMKTDKDPVVRQNARYSLGMFAAIQEVLVEGTEEEKSEVVEAIGRLYATGQVGQPPSMPDGRLKTILYVLGGALALLVVANLAAFFLLVGNDALPPPEGTPPAIAAGEVEPRSVDELTRQGLERITLLEQNLTGLQAKMEPVLEGSQPGESECPFGYTVAEPLAIASSDRQQYPEVADIYDTLNARLQTFDAANAAATDSCLGVAPIPEADAQTYLDELNTFQANIPDLRSQLNTVEVATETPSGPTATPTETPVPTATPDYSTHVSALYNIIDEVRGTRGANTILNQYWQEAQDNNGQTNGCRAGRPDIPQDYQLGSDADTAPESLRLAVENINLGLQALRDGWDNFESACEGGEVQVAAAASTGLTVSDSVLLTFDTAEFYLEQSRGLEPGAGAPSDDEAS